MGYLNSLQTTQEFEAISTIQYLLLSSSYRHLNFLRQSPKTHMYSTVKLTIPGHSHGQALLKSTVLAPVPVQSNNHTLAVSKTSILYLLLNAAPEETLLTKNYSNCYITQTQYV